MSYITHILRLPLVIPAIEGKGLMMHRIIAQHEAVR